MKLRDLGTFYGLYNDAIQKWRKKRIEIQLTATHKRNGKWGVLRALAIHIVHILLVRLDTGARIGSSSPFFHSQGDPIILEVFAENELVGCCSILRQSPKVFEIEVIRIVPTERAEFTMREILKAMKKYVRGLGASRIIVNTDSKEMADLFKNCGFTVAFLDDVLYFDLQEPGVDS